MKNLVPVGFTEKYDIKGSWINRTTTKKSSLVEMKSYTCRHCNQPFVYRSKVNRDILTTAASADNNIVRISAANSGSENVFSKVDKCKVSRNGIHDAVATLKDEDLKFKLGIKDEIAREIYDQLKSDSDFLCNIMNVMDYSLLISVKKAVFQNSSRTVNESPSSRNRLSEKGDELFEVDKVIAPHIYVFGIIDYLQTFNYKKQIEQFWKVNVMQYEKNGISCVEPGFYHDRFQKSVRDILAIDDDA